MPYKPTPKMLASLSVLALMLPLSSCGSAKNAPLSAGSRPAESRVTPADRSPIPDPDVACPTVQDPGRMCWSDQANAQIIAGMDSDITARDNQLCWLKVWFGYKPCPVEILVPENQD